MFLLGPRVEPGSSAQGDAPPTRPRPAALAPATLARGHRRSATTIAPASKRQPNLAVTLPFVGWDADAARRRSRAELARYGIALPAHLPVLFEPDELARLRPAEDAIARAVALYAVIAVSEGAPADMVRESLDGRGLTRWLSEREQGFIAQPAEKSELVQMSWRVEALAALAWALGLVQKLPLEGAEGVPAEVFAPIDPDGSRGHRDQHVQLRPVEQLADRLDLFYCAHWAAREHQLTGHFDPWPVQLVPGAIEERRHGLEWLFAERDLDWEELDLST